MWSYWKLNGRWVHALCGWIMHQRFCSHHCSNSNMFHIRFAFGDFLTFAYKVWCFIRLFFLNPHCPIRSLQVSILSALPKAENAFPSIFRCGIEPTQAHISRRWVARDVLGSRYWILWTFDTILRTPLFFARAGAFVRMRYPNQYRFNDKKSLEEILHKPIECKFASAQINSDGYRIRYSFFSSHQRHRHFSRINLFPHPMMPKQMRDSHRSMPYLQPPKNSGFRN